MRLPGFIGPSNENRSWNFDREDTINRYVELGDAGTPKNKGYLLPTPGLRPFGTMPEGPIRRIFYQDGRCFVLAGAGFYEIFATQQYIRIGDVASDNLPGTISSNGFAGHQLFVTSGGLGYIFDLIDGTFQQITDDAFPAYVLMGAFTDGYFVALDDQSTFHLSELLDGLTWNGLDVGQVSEASDKTLAMAVSHREIWLFGSKTTEPWQNIGAANFPYAPTSGTLIEHGIIAPWSVAILDNTLFWLGADERGAGVVWRAQGYTPMRVSTFAVEDYLQYQTKLEPAAACRIDNAIAWTYQDGGHLFYVLYLPNAKHHLVYDVATQQWHKRAIWNDSLVDWRPHVSRCQAYAFGKHLVGDRFGGTIYELNQDFYSDLLVEFFPVAP